MRHVRSLILLLASTAAVSGLAPASAAVAAAATPSVVQAASPATASASPVAATPAQAPVDFNVSLALGDQAGAEAFERAVSDPASPSYHQYISAAQWEKRFSPSQSSVKAVRSWLESEGVTIESVTPDRMTIQATATAATVQKAFGTTLGQYRHLGRLLRLSSAPLKVPGELAPLIAGVSGVDQNVATPDKLAADTPRPAAKSPKPNKEEIPQPPGFRNASPCSSFYAQKSDTTDPAYGGGYPSPLPYAPCGYVPAQLQGAYGLSTPIASGIDGKGVTVAIVDAYASPTLFSDANQYSVKNQPTQVLAAGQYSQARQPEVQQHRTLRSQRMVRRADARRRGRARHRARREHPLHGCEELPQRSLQLRPGNRRRPPRRRDHQLVGRQRRRPARLGQLASRL